jgi:hypothetical protein
LVTEVSFFDPESKVGNFLQNGCCRLWCDGMCAIVVVSTIGWQYSDGGMFIATMFGYRSEFFSIPKARLVTFYETAVVGYDVTECAPLLSYRLLDGNIVTAGCLSQPCLVTEKRFFFDPESKATALSDRPTLPYGKVGVVVGRGPPVMKRWFKNPEAMTKAVGATGG